MKEKRRAQLKLKISPVSFKIERRLSILVWGGEGAGGVSWKSNLAGVQDKTGLIDGLDIINLIRLLITLRSVID